MPEQPQTRRIPAPQTNLETKPFWEQVKKGVLSVGRCTTCKRAHYYPRSVCPFCFTDGATLEPASGRGTIYTISVTYRGTPEPYAIGYVELDEGPRILTNFVGAPLESFNIGDKVQVVFTPTDEGAPPVPMFAPA